MSDIVREVLEVLGVTALLLPAAAWIVRTLIGHSLSREMERFKADLRAETDRKLGEFRAHAHIRALEHEIRFRRLHDKVAETVADTFLHVSKYYGSVARYVSPLDWAGETKEEKLEELAKSELDLRVFLFEHQLFIPRESFKQISTLCDSLRKMTLDFKMGWEAERKGIIPVDGHGHDHWNIFAMQFKLTAVPLFETIHADFQRLLGFAIPGNNDTQK